MTTNALLQDQLAQLFREKLHLDVPSVDTDLVETGLLDSLQFVQLVLLLEEDFGMHVSLEDLDIDHFRSVGSIAAFVANGCGPLLQAHHEDR
jgi:acyl carrier protein